MGALRAADPGLVPSLDIPAPSWVPPASAGPVREAHTPSHPSHLLRRLQLPPRAEVGTFVQRAAVYTAASPRVYKTTPARECPVPRPLSA